MKLSDITKATQLADRLEALNSFKTNITGRGDPVIWTNDYEGSHDKILIQVDQHHLLALIASEIEKVVEQLKELGVEV